MKKILLTVTAGLIFSAGVFAQAPKRTCGTLQHHEYLKQTRPNYEADLVQYNQMIDQYLQDKAKNKVAAIATVTIPVVVHVVYNGAAENISDAQAASQVQVLNDDFAKLNADASKVTQATFSTVAAGANIRFCLAQRDPNGNATTGVVHKATTMASFGTNDEVKSAAQGGDDPWDVTKYVNIWICDLGSVILGYGEFPTGSLSNTWGLVLHYKYTGSGGTAISPYNLGRTGTHEFGHCFNLLHIWGDESACSGSDQCADTPNQGAEHYGCFAQGSIQTDACTSTGSGVMWMNYMDYTDDACMYMFTANQVSRMEAVVSTAPWNVLASSNGCVPVVLNSLDAKLLNIMSPVAGSSSCTNSVTPKVVISNNGNTTLTSATINYKMDAGTPQTFAWTGSLASTVSTTITLNNFTGLSAAAHTFSVWITAPNGGTDQNNADNSSTSTFTVSTAGAGSTLPFTENFETATFPPTGWLLQRTNTLNAANNWSLVANTTGLVAGSTKVAKMDNFSGTSIDIAGQIDALRTPPISFVGANSTLNLKFDLSHRVYNTATSDSLNIYISTNCGGSWTRLYTKGGAQLASVTGGQTTAFTPSVNTQWRRDSISLSSYIGQASVYLKFENRSDWGNNLYLDNINVSYQSSTGLASLQESLPILDLYPNPTTGILSLNIANINPDSEISVNVLNTFGQVVSTPLHLKNSANGAYNIDLSHLANGVYFMSVQTDNNKAVTKKIVISK